METKQDFLAVELCRHRTEHRFLMNFFRPGKIVAFKTDFPERNRVGGMFQIRYELIRNEFAQFLQHGFSGLFKILFPELFAQTVRKLFQKRFRVIVRKRFQ